MSEQVPQPWEVWHARFDFAEGRGYKHRPVIVLATRPDGSLVAMVTSAANKLALEHDYPIREWEAAGLDKPSIARLDRIAEIPSGYLGTIYDFGKSFISAPSFSQFTTDAKLPYHFLNCPPLFNGNHLAFERRASSADIPKPIRATDGSTQFRTNRSLSAESNPFFGNAISPSLRALKAFLSAVLLQYAIGVPGIASNPAESTR